MTKYTKLDAIFIVQLLALTSALTFASGLFAADDSFIKSYRASYTTKYKILPFTGTAVRELTQTKNGEWRLIHHVKAPVIKLTESSKFTWTNNQPKPISYRYKQSTLTKKRKISLDFDWPKMIATNSAPKQPLQIKLPENALDKLNYQLKLRYDLLTKGKPGTYDIVDRNRVKQYGFELLGEEQITTDLGKFNTVKLKRLRKEGSPRETIFWLAKDWDYLLLQINQNEKGKSYEIVLKAGELDGKVITGLPE